MNPTLPTILISGAGQLGSRYLQGLVKCRLPLRIYVQDIYEESLDRAEQRWDEAHGPVSHHTVSFHTSFESLPRQLNVAIVATTAGVRPQVIGEIADHSAVQFWVLEKVLAQSEAGLDEIMSSIGNGSSAWVNTPRRMLHWHQQIKSKLDHGRPMTLKVDGGSWGLACNSIHFLDMFAWWVGETLVEINTEQLDSQWFEAKRPGNFEVLGTLHAKFSGGSCVSLSARKGEVFYAFELDDGTHTWSIDEDASTAKRSDGFDLPGRLPFQSEMSTALVESILENGTCELPTLTESAEIHRVFIRSMLEHWKRSVNGCATAVPIT